MPTTTPSTVTLQLRPLPAGEPDPAALPPAQVAHVVADAVPGFPCRRCLRDADVGDELVLLAYDPFVGDSPYRQPGPIYLHRRDCSAQAEPLALEAGREPGQLRRRLLSVRAFDAAHTMTGAEVVPGTELVEAARRAFADPGTAYLHVHNAAPGCFAVRVDRC